MISSFFSNYLLNHIRRICEESGKVCPFWTNKQIEEDLKLLDEKDQGTREETYWLQCHSLYIVFRHNDIYICCRRNNVSLGNYYGGDCNYCNKELSEKIKNEIFPNMFK